MGRSRLPLAIAVAVAAAAAATLLLRPRSGLIEPAPVELKQYFTAFQLERAEDFRSLQRVLGLAGLGVGIGTLGGARLAPAEAAARPPRGAAAARRGRGGRGDLARCSWSRGFRSAPGCGSARSTWGCPRSRGRTGRSTWSRAPGIGAVTAAIGGLVAVALVRRFPRSWWAPGAVLVIAYGVITIWLYPIVIDPLFNKFEQAAARPAAQRRARGWRTAPGWTWARSTGWTRAAGPAPRTRT